MSEPKPTRGPCTCKCHQRPGTLHFDACCDRCYEQWPAHSAAPFTIQQEAACDDTPGIFANDAHGFHIATFWPDETGNQALRDANARLFKASPSLLKACKAAIRHLESQKKYLADDRQAMGHNEDAIRVLTEAIAQAET